MMKKIDLVIEDLISSFNKYVIFVIDFLSIYFGE